MITSLGKRGLVALFSLVCQVYVVNRGLFTHHTGATGRLLAVLTSHQDVFFTVVL